MNHLSFFMSMSIGHCSSRPKQIMQLDNRMILLITEWRQVHCEGEGE